VGGTSLASPFIAAVYALAGNGTITTDGNYPYSNTTYLRDVGRVPDKTDREHS